MLRQKFINELKKEFKELNSLFINENFKDEENRQKAIKYYKEYNFPMIKDLYKSLGYNISLNEDLYELLSFVLDSGYKESMIKHKNSSIYIPAFIYLLNYAPAEHEKFYEYCMKVHLTKDKEKLFLEDKLNVVESLFDTRIIDTLEMVMYAPDFTADLRTVLNVVDYIDYEETVNNNKKGEYYQELQKYKKELYAYIRFISSLELYQEFIDNRKYKNKEYKYSNIRFTKDTINLINNYIDIDTKEYKNKFYEFKEIEKKLKIGNNKTRKTNMLIGFTYRIYPDNFYDDFNDLNIEKEDLERFIKEYEQTGNKLNERQIETLLISFRNRYLEQNGLLEEYNKLNKKVKEYYEEYRKNNFSFYPEEFIKEFNKKYKYNFISCTFKNTELTREVYDLIINNNLLCGFDNLKETKLYKDYINNNKIDIDTNKKDKDNYEKYNYIYNKYINIVKGLYEEKDITNKYYIKRNVLEEEIEDFKILYNWYRHYNGEVNINTNNYQKTNTIKLLNEDLYIELINNNFNDRNKIVDKYYKFSEEDKLTKLLPKHLFYKTLHLYEECYSNCTGKNMYLELISNYLNNEDMFKTISKYNLSLNDLELVLNLIKVDDDIDIKPGRILNIIKDKLKDNPNLLLTAKCERRKEIKKEDNIKLLEDFINDSRYLSLKQYSVSHGFTKNKLKEVRKHLDDDLDICKLFDEKVRYLSESEENVERWLTESILNGVERKDGSIRPFNYLDYLLGTDYPIKNLRKAKNGFVKKFVYKNCNLDRYKEQNMIEQKMILNINGEMHEVTEEEKKDALKFIDDMELPHEIKVFDLVVKETLNKDLEVSKDINKTNDKILIKK